MNKAQIELPKYNSHKQVWALKIAGVGPINPGTDEAELFFTDKGFAPIRVDAVFIEKHEPEIGGYYIVYKDGYQSFSPADAFESGYTLA